MANAPGSPLKSGRIVIGLWDGVKLDTIGKTDVYLSPESLEAFVQAISLGSFSTTARRLGKSQSIVSEVIARLGVDLDLKLFDHSDRQPQLTETGRTLLGRVEEAPGASNHLRRVAALLISGSEPRVTLALSDTYHPAHYEACLAELDERYPELEFECLIAENQDVTVQVNRGHTTLGLLAAQPHYSPELGTAAVAKRAEFGLLAAVNHPLAGLEWISKCDFSEQRLLRLNTYSEASATINGSLPSSGGRCWPVPSYLLLLETAAHGFGWVELPHWLVSGYASGWLKELLVSGWPHSQAVDVVWSRQRPLGSATSWLLDHLLGHNLPIQGGPAEPRLSRRSRRRRGRRVPRRWTGDRGSDCDEESTRNGG